MLSGMNLFAAFGILSVLSGINYAAPVPADEADGKPSDLPPKLPFSLDLQPPFPDNSENVKAIVLPLRDSYGNPIPPSVLGVDPSGADYGLSGPISASPTIIAKKTVTSQGINFPIPSYASGITEIHRPSDGLLPPFDSSQKIKNRFSSSNTISGIPLPSNDLLPPLQDTQTKDDAINEISGTLTFNTPILDKTSAALNTLTSATITTTSNSPPTPLLESNTQSSADISREGKYTGGFGGAPGIFGEQKQVGYAITSTTTTTARTTTASTTPARTTATTTSTTPAPTTTTTTTTTPAPITTSTTSTTPTSTTASTIIPFPTFPAREVTTTRSAENRIIVPIGVGFRFSSNRVLPALSKVLLPPFRNDEERKQDEDLFTSPPTISYSTTTTTQAPTTTTTQVPTTPTTQVPTTPTTQAPTTTTTQASTTKPPPPSATIDLTNIPFPTTPPLNTLIRGNFQQPPQSVVPTLVTILLPPPFSSNARPFEAPRTPSPTSTSNLLTTPNPLFSAHTSSPEHDTFLSLSFGFPIAPTNQSSKKTAIGKVLQERFGANLNTQQLPAIVNSLVTPAPPAPTLSEPTLEPEPAISAINTEPQPSLGIPVIPTGQNIPPVIGTATEQTTSQPGKYTGGFGGAPGVLGQQNQIGFGIKKEGSSTDSSATVLPPPVEPVEAVAAIAPVVPSAVPAPVVPSALPALPASPAGTGKYTGSFGGPPGILVPYDNEKH